LSIAKPALWELTGVLTGAISRQSLDSVPEEGVQAKATRSAALLQASALAAYASRSGDHVQLSNSLPDQISLAIHVYGGEIDKMTCRPFAPDGRLLEPLSYANAETAPPYDIFSIQTEIRD